MFRPRGADRLAGSERSPARRPMKIIAALLGFAWIACAITIGGGAGALETFVNLPSLLFVGGCTVLSTLRTVAAGSGVAGSIVGFVLMLRESQVVHRPNGKRGSLCESDERPFGDEGALDGCGVLTWLL